MTCKKNPNHHYGSHLSECPWCKREALFGPTSATSKQHAPAPSSSKPPSTVWRSTRYAGFVLHTKPLAASPKQSSKKASYSNLLSYFCDAFIGLMTALAFTLGSNFAFDKFFLLLVFVGAIIAMIVGQSPLWHAAHSKGLGFKDHLLHGGYVGAITAIPVGISEMVKSAWALGPGNGFACFVVCLLFFWVFALIGASIGVIAGAITGTLRIVIKK